MLDRQLIGEKLSALFQDLKEQEAPTNTELVTAVTTCLLFLGMALEEGKEGLAQQALFDVVNNRYRPSVTQLNIVTAE